MLNKMIEKIIKLVTIKNVVIKKSMSKLFLEYFLFKASIKV